MNKYIVYLSDEQATLTLGIQLSYEFYNTGIIYLYGDLGVGKTTFIRGFLRGLGYNGIVNSPTYTLVEFYQIGTVSVYHMDLYRIADASELEFIGISEYFQKNTICLIEWPQNGINKIPEADIILTFDYNFNSRKVELITYSSINVNLIKNIYKL
ncbi:MAG: tRNA (adenosine(37)-N6)-threonylcarbamoyltransferase complex ATPase subunit type 1 TsaE [Pantoea sp. Brub]|nr:tRNA (adenosine(37)-N6)-threonylcarbamoyltransferase complex ATPase subunit type 1 TsaE [Pantoea sp. Brub]